VVSGMLGANGADYTSLVSGATPQVRGPKRVARAKGVQLHDILYRLSPDILYMVCSV
jgi:hypothetical protein